MSLQFKALPSSKIMPWKRHVRPELVGVDPETKQVLRSPSHSMDFTAKIPPMVTFVLQPLRFPNSDLGVGMAVYRQ